MANNRNKQVKKGSSAASEPFREICDIVFDRITDDSRPAPATLNMLAMEIIKDNPLLADMSAAEKDFFHRALQVAQQLSGVEITADRFYYRVING